MRTLRYSVLAAVCAALPAWAQAPAGSEFRVNTTTAGSQTTPAVAADADGTFVVFWESDGQDGSGLGVYAQRYNSAGAAQGAEFRVNTVTTGAQSRPAAAFSAPGSLVVVWQSFGEDGSAEGVFAQRYNASGIAQGAAFRVNTTTADSQSTPAVAPGPAGGFVVVWQSRSALAGFDIFAQRYDASGVALGPEFRVNTSAANDQTEPAVSSDATGNFVVVWQSAAQDGSDDGVYGQRYNPQGTAQGPEFRVNTFTAGAQRLPSMAMSPNGAFWVAWESAAQDGSGVGIYAQRFDATGVRQGPEFLVPNDVAGDQSRPSVAVDRLGNFFIAWEGMGAADGSGVFGLLHNPSGEAVGTQVQINTNTADTQSNIAAASTSLERFTAVWQSNLQDGSGWGIYGQRFGDLVFRDGFEVANAGSPAVDDLVR